MKPVLSEYVGMVPAKVAFDLPHSGIQFCQLDYMSSVTLVIPISLQQTSLALSQPPTLLHVHVHVVADPTSKHFEAPDINYSGLF